MGGGNDTIGKHRHGRVHHAPDITHQPAVAPAPGKTTGIELVDKGPLCKQEPTRAGCFLDADARQYLVQSYGFVLTTALGNFRDALQNQRIRLLTTVQKNAGAWGMLAELVFGWASHGLLGMLTRSVTAFVGRAAKVAADGGELLVGEHGYDVAAFATKIASIKPTLITGAGVQASKGLRTLLKNRAHAPSNPGAVASAKDVDKADFLTLIQNGIGPLANDLFTSAPAAMTDAELAAAVAAYSDMTYHSVSAYEADVVALLDLYDKEEIASIGDGLDLGDHEMASVRHAAWVSCGTTSRLAIVEVYDPIYAKTSPVKGDGKGHAIPWEQSVFISWVSDDMAGAAQDFQYERNGTPIQINATKADTGMPEVDAWAKEQHR